MKYHFKVHKEKKGYWAECIELNGCQTEGESIAELKKNMEDALNLYLNEPETSKNIFALPKKLSQKRNNIYEVPVRPEIAVAFLIRNIRLKMKMSQREFAKSLGFKNLWSYQRLERSGNPELKTLVMIKKRYPEIPFDDILNIN